MSGLYELGILLCRLSPPRPEPLESDVADRPEMIDV
jgi:hypothetical protein